MALTDAEKRVAQFLGIFSGLGIALFIFRVAITHTLRFWFISTNLALAWIALIISWFLARRLKETSWETPLNLLLTVLWLIFLPNTWYVITDFIHTNPTGEISQIYDIASVFCLAFSGYTLGLVSLLLIHREIRKRTSNLISGFLVEVIIFLSSFAIYLGRDLRWNTWDVITNPTGVAINVTDRIFDPFGQPRALNITLLFFVLVSATYYGFWRLVKPPNLRRQSKQIS